MLSLSVETEICRSWRFSKGGSICAQILGGKGSRPTTAVDTKKNYIITALRHHAVHVSRGKKVIYHASRGFSALAELYLLQNTYAG